MNSWDRQCPAVHLRGRAPRGPSTEVSTSMLPRVAVRAAVRRRGARLAAPRRTFFGGGAIVEDYETKKVMARRAKLRRFQAALGSARGDGAWQLASSALQEQATEGSFRDRAHLQAAVDAARAKLEPLHAEPTVLRLEEPTVPIPGVPDEPGGSGEPVGAPSAGPLAEAGGGGVAYRYHIGCALMK